MCFVRFPFLLVPGSWLWTGIAYSTPASQHPHPSLPETVAPCKIGSSFDYSRPVPDLLHYCIIALFTTTTTTHPTSHHPHASPPFRIRFILTWLPAFLSPSQSHHSKPLDLSSIRSTLTRLQHTLNPHFSTSRGCRYHPPNPSPMPPEKRAHPDLKLALPKSCPYSTLGAHPYPLRYAGIHPGSSPHPPYSPQTAVWQLYQIVSTTPCSVHSLLPATSANGLTLQGHATGLKLLPQRSISALCTYYRCRKNVSTHTEPSVSADSEEARSYKRWTSVQVQSPFFSNSIFSFSRNNPSLYLEFVASCKVISM